MSDALFAKRQRGDEIEYAHGDFGQTWKAVKSDATYYPEVVAREITRVWQGIDGSWAYSVEGITAASDDPPLVAEQEMEMGVEAGVLPSDEPHERAPETVVCRCGMIVRPEEHFCHLPSDEPRGTPTVAGIASETSPAAKPEKEDSAVGAPSAEQREPERNDSRYAYMIHPPALNEVIAAVLAEVARQDVEGECRRTPVAGISLYGQVFNAALAIREALRLKVGSVSEARELERIDRDNEYAINDAFTAPEDRAGGAT